MSAQREAEDVATADTVINPPRSERAAHPVLAPDDEDTVLTAAHGATSIRTAAAESPDDAEPAPPVALAGRARRGYYAFRVGDADAVTLDAPSYVGRRPSAPRIPTTVPPRLVSVPSPSREVSATHLEIRQVGTSIVIRDLATTNGSVVSLPGSVPRTLRQGESIVVSPGTLVDIGDDNVIQILPMHERPS